ncbi:MAG: WbqC family protein, partial [Planctomycetes bacterium]|nr:WbqC family protein [Planctomycetota bacterium]
MILSIQQPEHLPWMGYFNKLDRADKAVMLDCVQFKKRYFENRNKVRTRTGWTWLTVPVVTKGRYTQSIADVRVDTSRSWQRKMVSTIAQSYAKARFWSDFGPDICELLDRSWYGLAELNITLIHWLAAAIGIEISTVRGTDLDVEGNGTELILNICHSMGADTYLSGRDGANYLDLEAFERLGIRVLFQDFKHPEHSQL